MTATFVLPLFNSSSFSISGGALVGAGVVYVWCVSGASRCAIRISLIYSFFVFCPAAASSLSCSHLSRRIVSGIFWCVSGAVMVCDWCAYGALLV